jgi:cytoskeleton protein RodZ
MKDRPEQASEEPTPASKAETPPPGSLGAWLRQAREAKGVDMEQAELATRIRVRYLEAMEGDDRSILPDDVVGRGFLRNYALYLGLNPDEALRRSGWSAPALPTPDRPEVGVGAEPLSPGFRPLEIDLFVQQRRRPRAWIVLLVVVAAALVALGAYYGYPWYAPYVPGLAPAPATSTPTPTIEAAPTQTQAASQRATETLAIASPIVVDTPAPTWTFTPMVTPTRTPTPTRRVYTGITLELNFTNRSWVQVTLDGVRAFQGELDAGATLTWTAERQAVLRVGNAGAVEVTINGEALGTLGEEGEVVDRVFEVLGGDVLQKTTTPAATGTVVTATLTAEMATGTPTVIGTPTMTPTLPISPTVTAVPTATP